MKDLEIKKQLLELLCKGLEGKIKILSAGMNRAQEEANEHGTIENKYDTFIEEAHTLKAGYAMQLGQTENILASMRALSPKICAGVEPGSIIQTSVGAFFVSSGLISEQLEVEGVKYDCVNINAPIIQRIQRLPAGKAEIEMNGQKIKILRIF